MPKAEYPRNPLPCGCGAVGIPELDHGEERERFKHIHVRFCPLHQAAPELLEALKAIAQIASNLSDEHLTDKTGPNDAAHRGLMYCHARELARAAIAKAGER